MAKPIGTLVNGQTYGWTDLDVVILGRRIVGIQAINYTDEQEMESIYGAGNKPIGIGRGPITFEGSITLLKSEVEALQAAVPLSGRIQEIPPFDIVVHYNTGVGGKIANHILKGCKFKSNARNIEQGATSIPVELQLLISDIQYL